MWSCICGDDVAVPLDVESLAQHSSYFGALLHSQMRETKNLEIDLGLFASTTVRLLLKIFTNSTTVINIQPDDDYDIDDISDVLELIDYLGMTCLYTKVCAILVGILPKYCSDIHKLWRFWLLCDKYSLDEFRLEICKYLSERISEKKESDHLFIQELPYQLIKAVLKMPNLCVSNEVEVMKIIFNWICYCKEERLQHVESLFQCVHIPSLVHPELEHIQKLLDKLENSEINIKQIFTSYMIYPHKFFHSRPEQCKVRAGKEVIVSFGGVYHNTILNNDAYRLSRSRGCMLSGVPMMYQEVSTVKTNYLSQCDSQNVSSIGNDLVLKLFKRFKSPFKLMEFGICTYQSFVYIAGGQGPRARDDAKLAVSCAFRLDPHLGEWTMIKCMNEARCLFYLGETWGQLYAVGGANRYGILNTVECYNPLEDTWTDGPPLPSTLHEHAGCIFNGKLYICGGHDGDCHTGRLLALESQTGPWIPLASMCEPRGNHALQPVQGKLYVFGGSTAINGVVKDLYSVEEYDTQTDFWVRVMTVNLPINGCLPIVMDTDVLFVGSYSFEQDEYLSQATSINVANQEWSVSAIETKTVKRLVGFQCLKMEMKGRLLK